MFDLTVLVLACLTNSSLKKGTSLHAFESQKLNLELNPFPDGQPVKIF